MILYECIYMKNIVRLYVWFLFLIFTFAIVYIVYNAESPASILKYNLITYPINSLPHAVFSCSPVNNKQSQDLGLTVGFHFLCYYPDTLKSISFFLFPILLLQSGPFFFPWLTSALGILHLPNSFSTMQPWWLTSLKHKSELFYSLASISCKVSPLIYKLKKTKNVVSHGLNAAFKQILEEEGSVCCDFSTGMTASSFPWYRGEDMGMGKCQP